MADVPIGLHDDANVRHHYTNHLRYTRRRSPALAQRKWLDNPNNHSPDPSSPRTL
jgi:hypothetical protein